MLGILDFPVYKIDPQTLYLSSVQIDTHSMYKVRICIVYKQNWSVGHIHEIIVDIIGVIVVIGRILQVTCWLIDAEPWFTCIENTTSATTSN